MKIQLNGQSKNLASTQSLKEFVASFCKKHNPIIAEVNGKIIKSNNWETVSLKDGDVVELVSFVGGG